MEQESKNRGGRPRLRAVAPPNPSGLCMCGCGEATSIAARTDTNLGYVAGHPVRFVLGHSSRKRVAGDERHPLRHDGWLTGFADGEGCFFVTRTGRVGFAIGLRADDAGILLQLQDAFGGGFSCRRAYSANEGPKAQWTVTSRVGVQALVAYFDRFPLRSKKARDYALWRQAAMRERDPLAVWDDLRGVRRYAA